MGSRIFQRIAGRGEPADGLAAVAAEVRAVGALEPELATLPDAELRGRADGLRRRAYAADGTYLTAKEAGFDLLRDGLCLAPGEQVRRPFHFALVDEADSILIDEARIPLVIAGVVEQETSALPRLAELARRLRPGTDFDTDEARRNVYLTERGVEEAERERVVELGGLYVLGTHRHESVRIDDQLRGRAGRQGDPGSSRFFVALDDPLLERAGIARLVPEGLFPDESDALIDSKVVRREVARAQRITEGQLSDARRRLYELSEILERQREYVAEWRQDVLEGRAELDLLEERCAERWRWLREEPPHGLGADGLREIERRLTLLTIDRCWSEHLTELQAVRDEVHLVALDGRLPIAEFYRTAIAGFEALLARIDDEVVEAFEALRIGADGPDWDEAGLRGPSATWTYLVHDAVFGDNLFLGLSTRASIGLWAVLLLWPLLFAWGIYLQWKWRREAKRGGGR